MAEEIYITATLSTNDLLKLLACDLNHLHYLQRRYPSAFQRLTLGGGKGRQSSYEDTPRLRHLIQYEADRKAIQE